MIFEVLNINNVGRLKKSKRRNNKVKKVRFNLGMFGGGLLYINEFQSRADVIC